MARSRTLQIIISAKDKSSRAFKSIRARVGKLSKSILSLKAGFVALAGTLVTGAVAKSFVGTASKFENLTVSLTTVTGSLEKAKEAMAFANEEAAKSPYTVFEYAEAIKTLAAYGLDYEKNMRTLGDTAAAMGKPLQQAVEALSDAVQGEGDRLKEFGKKQRVEGNKITYTWVDALGKVRKTIAENNPKIIEAALRGIWNEKYQGGMDKFSKTWTGLTSTLKSQWDDFKLAVMDSGAFQGMKDAVQGVINKVNELKKSGKFDLIAKDFGEKTASTVSILYGGSMKPDNARELLAQNDIDGGLIGGASLDADTFAQISTSYSE